MNLKEKRNKIIAFVLAVGLLLMCTPVISAYADTYNYESSSAQAYVRSAVPSDSYPINMNINGRSVLSGRIFNWNSITYVPMAAFSDWVGVFTHSFNRNTATATLVGTNLKITARAGDLYIVANDRYFYTGNEILLVGNEIYVPILPMVKALNSHMEWSGAENSFYVRSGDSRLLDSGSDVYNADEVYWLARIISAEARGEPMKGKIAVGNVVLNRVRSSAFPNTIYGVIFDRKYGVQFAPVSNGTIYNKPTDESVIAAKMCLEGYSLSADILYFVNPGKAPNSWIAKSRQYAFTVGNHAFFE